VNLEHHEQQQNARFEAAAKEWAAATDRALLFGAIAIAVSLLAAGVQIWAAFVNTAGGPSRSDRGSVVAAGLLVLVFLASVAVVVRLRRFPRIAAAAAIAGATVGLAATVLAQISHSGWVASAAYLVWAGYGVPLVLCAAITLLAVRSTTPQVRAAAESYFRLHRPRRP
jgi:hypothetical protein